MSKSQPGTSWPASSAALMARLSATTPLRSLRLRVQLRRLRVPDSSGTVSAQLTRRARRALEVFRSVRFRCVALLVPLMLSSADVGQRSVRHCRGDDMVFTDADRGNYGARDRPQAGDERLGYQLGDLGGRHP